MPRKFILVAFFISRIIYAQHQVKLGADLLISDYYYLIDSKNLGLIVNQTSCLSDGVHLVDALYEKEVSINALFPPVDDKPIKTIFAPEHGIRGDNSAGETAPDGIDSVTGIPIRSLYGNVKKPTPEMLNDIDLLIFDIQDVGTRFYTYISTLYYIIEAAGENNKPVIVLDRPNPIGGEKIEGPIIEPKLLSFVGIAPIPIRHGMTIGELALYFSSLVYNKSGIKVDLQIIRMDGWEREFYFDDSYQEWIKPSPNMIDLNTAFVYPGMCLLEGTNVSEGRGTQTPFLIFGAPYINAEDLLNELSTINIQGIDFKVTEFIPVAITSMAPYPKYKDQKCFGLQLRITDRNLFEPVAFGVTLLSTLYRLYPSEFEFNNNWIDKLFGAQYLREMIINGEFFKLIISKWTVDTAKFKKDRKKFLLY